MICIQHKLTNKTSRIENVYTVKPVQTEPPSDRADPLVFRGVRFSQYWVFSAMCTMYSCILIYVQA